MTKKIFIKYYYGMLDYDKVVGIERTDKSIYAKTMGGSINIFRGYSNEKDEELAREEVEQQVVNVVGYINRDILRAFKSQDEIVTVDVLSCAREYIRVLKDLEEMEAEGEDEDDDEE